MKDSSNPKKEFLLFKVSSIVSLVLGFVVLVCSAAYLICRFLNERAYREKWKDYEECGLM
jgi:hypothetical protein